MPAKRKILWHLMFVQVQNFSDLRLEVGVSEFSSFTIFITVDTCRRQVSNPIKFIKIFKSFLTKSLKNWN